MAGRVGRILREGFDEPDQLVDGVTYVKAAEVIRMLRLVLGKGTFLAGKTLYFDRYKDSNANSDQFFECFEEVSGQSLEQFKTGWLTTVGYPRVKATTARDKEQNTFRIDLRQDIGQGLKPFHLPLEVALVDSEGRTIPGTEQVLQLRDQEASFMLEGVSGGAGLCVAQQGVLVLRDFRAEGHGP